MFPIGDQTNRKRLENLTPNQMYQKMTIALA